MDPSRCHQDAADRVAKAASDGFALVETEVCWESVSTVKAEFVATALHRDDDVMSSFHAVERPSLHGTSGTLDK